MNINKPVARFISRGCDEKDGLIIGSALRGSLFKPNTVYEIMDTMGEYVIREVGESIIAGVGEKYEDAPSGDTWASDIGCILNTHGKTLFLTREEYAQHLEQVMEGRR